MGIFNSTLCNDLQDSGQLKMIAKTLYPDAVPQQPSRLPARASPCLRRLVRSSANANYLAFGYTAAQNSQMVLYGWLFDVRAGQPQLRASLRQDLFRFAG